MNEKGLIQLRRNNVMAREIITALVATHTQRKSVKAKSK